MAAPLTDQQLDEIEARIPAGQHPWQLVPRIVGYEGGQEEREEGFEIVTAIEDGELLIAEVHDDGQIDFDDEESALIDEMVLRRTTIEATHDLHPDAASIAQFILHAQRDMPALIAEVKRLRAGLRELAEGRDAQEVVCTDGLRIGGESGAIVRNGSFNAVHIEDLGDAIERLLDGTN